MAVYVNPRREVVLDSGKLVHVIHKFMVKVFGPTNYVLSMKLVLTLSLTPLLFIPLILLVLIDEFKVTFYLGVP